jgi:hypothetical protein
MADRALKKSECGYCFRHFYLDSLIRMEIIEPQSGVAVFNNILCDDCAVAVREYWWRAEPTFNRYYHPA